TTVAQLATTTAAGLTARGFTIVGTPGDAATQTYTSSVIEYPSAAELPAARTLAAQFSDVTLRHVPGVTPGPAELILGSTFRTLPASPSGSHGAGSTASPDGAHSASPSPKPSSSVGRLAKNFGGINGTANCRTDAKAFQP